MKTIIIAAVAANGVIGRDGDLPWNYPADMKHFMRTTAGYPCLMGRKTYESLRRRPLPGRTNIVLTANPGYDAAAEVVIVGSYEEARSLCDRIGAGAMFVCGGEAVYRRALAEADEMILTHLPEEVSGETFFPDWDAEEWEMVDNIEQEAVEKKTGQKRLLRWSTYRRIRLS